MESFQHIDVKAAQQMVAEQQAVMVDIRDPQSFAISHPSDAFHLTNDSIVEFMQQYDFEHPVLVMCYHGVSSQGAAQYLINQGFEQVYSVDGGFAEWQKHQLPVQGQ
ncbi:thiosulfate sulfurtransferase GlpE [Vibrio sp. SCSIO 43136]|uniref:thiosulfate sulfurtransferase GlpE n=1 Tax=Vibrio sp. SCSIO 43136 TaxID=2819101 RepID=UPI0020750059|nr:thiosulfate sulfurtransferase GlpE [Vibrio sp. SCSIO 43136]USD65394.1 thiosulfate sulfurtransferase GlpE [Vibrio sp. SCSIO 43136]